LDDLSRGNIGPAPSNAIDCRPDGALPQGRVRADA